MHSHSNGPKAVKDWIAIRLSALAAIPLCIWLVYSIVRLAGADYLEFTAWLRQPVNAVLLILMIAVTFYHAALGCHEIIEDYVHAEKYKNKSLLLKKLIFFVLGAVCIISILKVVFAS